jgi:hypothetical protein
MTVPASITRHGGYSLRFEQRARSDSDPECRPRPLSRITWRVNGSRKLTVMMGEASLDASDSKTDRRREAVFKWMRRLVPWCRFARGRTGGCDFMRSTGPIAPGAEPTASPTP